MHSTPTKEEIRKANTRLGYDKAVGPDGTVLALFKKIWQRKNTYPLPDWRKGISSSPPPSRKTSTAIPITVGKHSVHIGQSIELLHPRDNVQGNSRKRTSKQRVHVERYLMNIHNSFALVVCFAV